MNILILLSCFVCLSLKEVVNVMYVMYLMANGRSHETSLALSRVGCLGTPAQAWNYTRKIITFDLESIN